MGESTPPLLNVPTKGFPDGPGAGAPPAAGSPALSRLLAAVPFFEGLADEDLDAIASAGIVRAVPRGQVVFREADPADRLYVVLSGQARIFKMDDQGNEITLARPGAGEFFGELALLDGGRRSAGAVTAADCDFFTLERTAFLDTLLHLPGMLGRVMTGLTAKIRESGERALREEMEARMLRAEAELQRHRSLSRVVAGVAHELNTPLGIARTAASVLREVLPGPGAEVTALPVGDMLEAVDLLDRNILRANKLVQDFKSVSIGQITDVRETLDLMAVVDEIVSLYRIEAKRAGLEIRVEDALPDGHRTWVGYRGYLTQVILNLLTNAERYAYPDRQGGRVEIAVSSGEDGGEPQFEIRVRDHGAGIPREVLAKVFEPFYTTGRGRGGTGLGMAIAHNLVTSGLGGAIRIASEPGRGTSVHFTFPRSAPEQVPVHAATGAGGG